MKRHFLPVAMLATMMLVGAVLPVYAAENQENEETITRVVVSEKEVQDISSSFLALATEGEAVQSAKTKIAAKEKAEKEAAEKAAAEKAAAEKAAKEQAAREAQAAAEKEAAEQAAAEAAAQAATTQPVGQTFIMESTAYSSDPADALGGGTVTATGQNLLTNPMAVAVDPNVIPLGTRLYVEGYGEAIASDTGGAIKGNIVDVHFSTYEQCIQWGRRQVKVTILE
ncbi:MAG: 3D domain-containing protein [Enterococcus aquimarinus]|uniref:3D domain-containing protein n=1 Tax=Enterococcus aquimarinus TaxID=328396 RepID=A0A9E3ZUW9_9ENTE|nr:3D domain-containing protein [Enterococcus aquimarinus]